MVEGPGRVGGFVPLLAMLLLGAVAWEVGGADGDLMMMGQVERKLPGLSSECQAYAMAGCFPDEDEEEFALDSETNRMLQSMGPTYISKLAQRKGSVPCQYRFRSYPSCRSPARSPFHKYNRCTGTCLRKY